MRVLAVFLPTSHWGDLGYFRGAKLKYNVFFCSVKEIIDVVTAFIEHITRI